MAIVKGPLMSVDARGQLGKTLVFIGWKGVKDVRAHVVPANPKTAAQQAQRGYMAAAVKRWHGYSMTNLDVTAVEQLAAIQGRPMSGFNAVTKLDIDAAVHGESFQLIAGLAVSGVTSSGFTVAATGRAAGTYTLKYGTSPTVLTGTASVTNTAGALSATLSGLSASTKYYFQILATDAGHQDVSGIGSQTTAAA